MAEQYLIGGGAQEDLHEILKAAEADSTLRVIEVQGGAEAPTLIVVEMDHGRAEQLKAELAGRAVVERNVPLEPL